MSADEKLAKNCDMADEARSNARFEPPDVVHIRLVGILDKDEAVRVTREMVSIAARVPSGILVLADVRFFQSMTSDARRDAVSVSKGAVVRAAAIVGASFSARVLLTLIRKGAQLMTGRYYPMGFFDDELEGRRWLEEQRAPAQDP